MWWMQGALRGLMSRATTTLCMDFGREISRSAFMECDMVRSREKRPSTSVAHGALHCKQMKNSRLYRNRNLFTLEWAFHSDEISSYTHERSSEISPVSITTNDAWVKGEPDEKWNIVGLFMLKFLVHFPWGFVLFCKSLISTNKIRRFCRVSLSRMYSSNNSASSSDWCFFVFVGFKLPLPSDREKMHQQHN